MSLKTVMPLDDNQAMIQAFVQFDHCLLILPNTITSGFLFSIKVLTTNLTVPQPDKRFGFDFHVFAFTLLLLLHS